MPVVVWMSFIFFASTDLGSAAHTSRFLVPFLHWLNPEISARAIASVQFFIRKAAHLSEYALLAILLLRALRSQRPFGFWKPAAVVLFVAALYAVTDEFHQSFIPTRTPSVRDVMIDTTGALVGLAIYRLAMIRSQTPQAANSLS